jgi:hypothetical protein
MSVFITLLEEEEEEEEYKSKRVAFNLILSHFFEFSYRKKGLASFYMDLSL